jgi:hypothetical protein
VNFCEVRISKISYWKKDWCSKTKFVESGNVRLITTELLGFDYRPITCEQTHLSNDEEPERTNSKKQTINKEMCVCWAITLKKETKSCQGLICLILNCGEGRKNNFDGKKNCCERYSRIATSLRLPMRSVNNFIWPALTMGKTTLVIPENALLY